MTTTLTPGDKIIALLRTLTDAQQSWDPRSGGDGAHLMPRTYHEGSYQELERCLTHMRTTNRTTWWHVSHRYRWGTERWATITYRQTRKGKHPQLPHPHCELRIAGPTLPHQLMRAKLYEWSPDVNTTTVTQGITWLTHHMHNGNTTQLKLPLELLWHELGIHKGDTTDDPTPTHQPRTRHREMPTQLAQASST